MNCRVCAEPTEFPDRLCSSPCREEFYGETNAELYADERHPEDSESEIFMPADGPEEE